MPDVKIEHLDKIYDGGVQAVYDFNLDINDGEFIVLVGPSGCGKSTTLRMVAGLEDISAGKLTIDGKDCTRLPPKDRDIAMVFQNYALYGHMTIYENMAFSLTLRKEDKQVIHRKVMAAAEILDLKTQLNKKPKQLSGGQRQRVAMGRAIVRNPKVFLFDEPLSNLDAKLRTQMRSEIVKLHKALKTTFIYVTHDQVEAMTMGSRIVVMKDGFIKQIDTPTNLFDYPENKFVAGFIGTPQMNFFRVEITKKAKTLYAKFTNGETLKLSLDKMRPVLGEYLDGNPHEVYLGVRGEHVCVGESGVSASVNVTEILGSDMHVFFEIEGQEGDLIACLNGRLPLATGDRLHISFSEENVHLFDAESEKSILGRKE